VIPIIYSNESANFPNLDHHKYLNHRGFIKLKMEKGSYNFKIISNTQQEFEKLSNNGKDLGNESISDSLYPKCFEFQIRMKAYKLNSISYNWKCIYEQYDLLPSTLNNVRDLGLKLKSKETFAFYSNRVVMPSHSHIMKIRTAEAALIRITIENNNEGTKNLNPLVTLMKGDKTLRTSKSYKRGIYSSTQK